VCGEEVTTAVLRIVKGEESAEIIKNTCLALTPKVKKNPTLLSQFRPISLCNVLYKISSKVISNQQYLARDYFYGTISLCSRSVDH
jgi:hypothetical protein